MKTPIITGYHEVLYAQTPDGRADFKQVLGTRSHENAYWKPDRALGTDGLKQHYMFKTFEVQKDGRTVVIQCDERRPFKCYSVLVADEGEVQEPTEKKWKGK